MAGPMVQSGKLRHRVTIQTYTTTVSSYGQQTRSWATYASRWAEKVQQPARELEKEGKMRNFGRVQFRVRQVDGITPDMRVLDGSQPYNIISIQPDPTYARTDIILCEEVSANV